jgi:hypothetical protein
LGEAPRFIWNGHLVGFAEILTINERLRLAQLQNGAALLIDVLGCWRVHDVDLGLVVYC